MSEQAETTQSMIIRCLQGEQTAFSLLYEQFASGVYHLCYSLLLNRQDAEDVTQDSFVYAFKNLHRFDSQRASFKTWLYTIAVSRCRNMYRRKRFPTLDLSQLLNFEASAPKSETPEAVIAQHDAKDAIEDALASLTPRLREAIALRYGQGLTYREMAAIMGCPQKTAESRVRLAHEALRGMLQPIGRGLLDELMNI